MMKLFDRLPEGVTVGKRFIPCDFDFRNVLRMLDVMQMTDIYPDARDYLCIKCVVYLYALNCLQVKNGLPVTA